MSNVIPFPREVSADADIRNAERMIKRLLRDIEEGAGSTDQEARMRGIIAPPMLELWQERLQDARLRKEGATADDVIRYGGIVYRAYPSQRGAH